MKRMQLKGPKRRRKVEAKLAQDFYYTNINFPRDRSVAHLPAYCDKDIVESMAEIIIFRNQARFSQNPAKHS